MHSLAATAARRHPLHPPKDRAMKKSNLPTEAKKAAGTQRLAADVPHHADKLRDFGREDALNPPTGRSAKPSHPSVTVSTLSETQASAKTGSGDPPIGTNATIGSLDRVRADG